MKSIRIVFVFVFMLVGLTVMAQPARIKPPTKPQATAPAKPQTTTPAKPTTGTLIITSSPSGAKINVYGGSPKNKVNGRYRGETPLTIERQPGRYSVTFSAEGYVDTTKYVTITAGKTVTCSVTLRRKQTVKASYANGILNVNGVQYKMVFVEGGTFQMGSNDGYPCEQPEHYVTLSSYYIGQTEVTQTLWQAVMGSNPSFFKGGNLPVENVSWEDCQMFITKLNQLAGQRFRMPTEAEWEYAARGGKNSKGYKYSGSNTLDNVAWYWENSGDSRLSGNWDSDRIKANHCKTHPVTTKQANELVLYDMSGNVLEWCQDWYGPDYYHNSPNSNPIGPSSGSDRVSRGGNWSSAGWCCSVFSRNNCGPWYRDNNIGLRLALTSLEKESK